MQHETVSKPTTAFDGIMETIRKETGNIHQKPRHLIKSIYTANPRAHVYNGKIYIFPSHDINAGIPEDDTGAHFDMRDYHVYSREDPGGDEIDHGVALDIKDVPWASRQMWSNDVAPKGGTYYMYFPAKDKKDIFRIGVAVSDNPDGPYKAMPEPMKGSLSIDPSTFQNDDGTHYVYFGGIWGETAEAVIYKDIPYGETILSVKASPLNYVFTCLTGDAEKISLGSAQTRELSSETIGGFSGVYMGMYTSGNGTKSQTNAVF